MKLVLSVVFLLFPISLSNAAETLSLQEALEAAGALHAKNAVVAGMIAQASGAPPNQQRDTYRAGILVLLDASLKFQSKWSADTLAASSATPPRLSELNSFSPCLWLANTLTELSFELAESRQWKDRFSEAVAEHTGACDAALGLRSDAQ
ncbi:hypothetical protein [uncultured Roseibium sp.]|uniref:hypothetical protein n=1 Tax=uncultured Roseibium sp. TaxID=1936171 RepID=UPI002625CC81|nr:hypothetical protein [uncultured Roseibium sp.]